MKRYAVALTNPLDQFGYVKIVAAEDYKEAFINVAKESGADAETIDELRASLDESFVQPEAGQCPSIARGFLMLAATEVEDA